MINPETFVDLRKFHPGTGRRTRGYCRWCHMKERVLNPKYPYYHRYGGRGLTINPYWVESYAVFQLYCSTLPGYNDPWLTMDKDARGHNQGYHPGTIQFISREQQAAKGMRAVGKPTHRARKPIPPFAPETTQGDLGAFYDRTPGTLTSRFQRYGRVGSALCGLEAGGSR